MMNPEDIVDVPKPIPAFPVEPDSAIAGIPIRIIPAGDPDKAVFYQDGKIVGVFILD